METNAQGHHDHNRRRARVQNVRTPFGSRRRVSACGRRYPGRCFGRRHTGGWLVGRGPTAGLAVWVVVMVTYGKRAAPAPAGAGNAQLPARMAPMNPARFVSVSAVGGSAGGSSGRHRAAIGTWYRACSMNGSFACQAICLATSVPSPDGRRLASRSSPARLVHCTETSAGLRMKSESLT